MVSLVFECPCACLCVKGTSTKLNKLPKCHYNVCFLFPSTKLSRLSHRYCLYYFSSAVGCDAFLPLAFYCTATCRTVFIGHFDGKPLSRTSSVFVQLLIASTIQNVELCFWVSRWLASPSILFWEIPISWVARNWKIFEICIFKKDELSLSEITLK